MASRVFPVVVGVVLGGVVSVLASHVFFSGEARAGGATARGAAATSDDGREDLGALERRLDALGARVQSLSAEAHSATPTPTPAPPAGEKAEGAADGEREPTGPARPPAPADLSAELQARAFEREQEHAAEPVDPAWAPTARQNFEDELGSASGAVGAHVNSVDCRTRVCKVELAWKSYDEATERYYGLVSAPRRENCGFLAFMPPPAERAAGYQQTVYYDCR